MLSLHLSKHLKLHAACCLAVGLAAGLAASHSTTAAAAAAAAGAAAGGLGGGWVELREVRRHLNDGVGSFESIPASMMFTETDEEEEDGNQEADSPEERDAAFFLMSAASSSTSEEPDAGAAAAATEEGETAASAGGEVSCEVFFEGGDYKQSPTVRVHASAHASGHALGLESGEGVRAVMLDESARCWLHGDRGDVTIPSTFVFGEKGREGDFAAIHPPKGTGKHKYTVILFKGAPQLGPLLSSLRGTPWNDRRRAVGSIEKVKKDFEKQNRTKPIELCRCSVYVSYENIHPATDTP
ncbi:hypothetical protein Emag_000557 [Eimeria magna]